jgi:hypothetical protein
MGAVELYSLPSGERLITVTMPREAAQALCESVDMEFGGSVGYPAEEALEAIREAL